MFQIRCSRLISAVALILSTNFFTATAHAAIADLSWSRNAENNVVNYRLYYGTAPSQLTNTVNVGNNVTIAVTDLSQGSTYYFAVSAINSFGLESPLSSVIVLSVPAGNNPDPGSGGGNPPGGGDNNPPDTNPDPFDPSVNPAQSAACGSPYSVASGIDSELVVFNPGNISADVGHLMRDSDGGALASFDSSTQIGGIFSSSLNRYSANIPGRVAEICNESLGHADGELVFSRLGLINSVSKQKKVLRNALGAQFKFAAPINVGVAGQQVIQFNTVHPGKGNETANLVKNELIIENLSNAFGDGTLYVFNSSGVLAAQQRLRVPIHGNFQYSLHNLGRFSGIAFWTPDNLAQKFNVSNRVFIADNARGQESYTTAYRFNGSLTGGTRVMVPVNLEGELPKVTISNVSERPNYVTTYSFDAQGVLRSQEVITMPGRSSIARDPSAAFKKSKKGAAVTRGFMVVTTATANSILVSNTQMAKLPGGKLAYAYAMQGKVATGADLSGYFSVWNGDKATLWLMNSSASRQNITISLLFPDGSYRPIHSVALNGNGGQYVDFARIAAGYSQGVFAVQAENQNAVSAIALRGQTGRYFYTSEVRE